MPRYSAADIQVRLRATSLSQSSTTSHDVIGVGKGKQDIEGNEDRLARGSELPERTIKDGEDDGIVRFLGDLDKRPFFLVRAGHRRQTAKQELLARLSKQGGPKHSSNSSLDTIMEDGSDNNHIGQARPHNKDSCEALAITIETTAHSFPLGTNDKPMDLKVEVFYNGEFVVTNLLKKTHGNPKLVFSGQRIHHSLERPWVLGGPKTETAATLSDTQRRQIYEERWRQINGSLSVEATKRGVDKRDRPLPITDYLMSLATCPFPDGLADDKNPLLDPNMGIIDVIVSLGNGKKHTQEMEYSYSPSRLLDLQYVGPLPVASNRPLPGMSLSSDDQSYQAFASKTSFSQSSSQSSNEPRQTKSSSQHSSSDGLQHSGQDREDTPMTDASAKMPPPKSRAELARREGAPETRRLMQRLKARDREDPLPNTSSQYEEMTTKPLPSAFTHRPLHLPPKQVHTLPPKLTSETFPQQPPHLPLNPFSPQKPTNLPPKPTFLTSPQRPIGLPPKPSSPAPRKTLLSIHRSPVPATPKPKIKLKFSQSRSQSNEDLPAKTLSQSNEQIHEPSIAHTAPTSKQILTPAPTPDVATFASPVFGINTRSGRTGEIRAPTPDPAAFATPVSNIKTRSGRNGGPPTQSTIRKKRSYPSVVKESYDWKVPALSKNSVATYASKEMLRDQDDDDNDDFDITPGMCRQVRKERSGEFTEECILMGVRFVVG